MLVIDGWTYNELTDGTPANFIAPCRCCCEQNHSSAFGCNIYEASRKVTVDIYVCSYCYVRLRDPTMCAREIISYLNQEPRPTRTNRKVKNGSITRLVRDPEAQADDTVPDDAA